MSDAGGDTDAGGSDTAPSRPEIDDAFLAGIVRSSFHPFAVLAGDGTILFLSSGISDILGAPAEHFIGSNMTDFLAPASLAQAIEAFENFTDPHRPQTGWDGPAMTITLLQVDGNEITCRALAVPSGDPSFDGLVLQIQSTLANRKLDDAIASMAQGDPIATTLGLILEFATEQMPFSVGVIGLDHDGDDFGSVIAHSAAPNLRGSGATSWLPLDGEPTPWGSVVLGNSVDAMVDTADLPEPIRGAALDAGLPGCWAFSLTQKTRSRDVLVFWRRARGAPGPHLAEAIQRIIRLVQLALESNRTRQLLELQANTDELTGLANRAALTDQLEHLRDDPPEHPIGVLYCDLDDFKPINDQLGHMIGDQVLTIAARRIESSVRDDDLAVRIGGDEFAVLCLHTSPEALTQLADRLIDAFATPIRVADHEVDLGISVGLALVDPTVTRVDPERILGRADAALLRAKAGGKGTWQASDPA